MLTHRIVAYLVSLAVGYWVLTLADKQNGFTKTLGRVIGWIILVVSLLGPLCLAGKAVFCYSNPYDCRPSESCPWNEGGHGWGGACHMGMGHCMEGDEKGTEGGMMPGHGMKKGMMDGMKDKAGSDEKAPAKDKSK